MTKILKFSCAVLLIALFMCSNFNSSIHSVNVLSHNDRWFVERVNTDYTPLLVISFTKNVQWRYFKNDRVIHLFLLAAGRNIIDSNAFKIYKPII